jgi:hypothetical protein
MHIPIIGALICKIRGRHKRGKPYNGVLGTDKVFYSCPTCGRLTSYRRKDTVVPIRAAG